MVKKQEKDIGRKAAGAIGGILGGLTEIVERLAEIAEKGDELSKVGNLDLKGGGDKNLKGVYGVSFKVGLGGKDVKVEPFGNVRKDNKTGESVVQEIHEPITDVFEEEDHVLVIAEMPGIDAEDVRYALKDDILTISAEIEGRRYRKEILLPAEFRQDQLAVSSKNGIIKIKCSK